MQLEIRGPTIALPRTLVAHVQYRLGSALARVTDRVRAVSVRFSDTNGHRGGPDDKLCRVQVHLTRGNTIVLSEKHFDYYRAVDHVAARLRHIVRESLARRREAHRRGRRHPT